MLSSQFDTKDVYTLDTKAQISGSYLAFPVNSCDHFRQGLFNRKVDALTPRKLLKSESGMSLVELMMIIGIIFVLTYIGQNQYGKYKAKANLGQGKAEITRIWAAMTTFQTHFNDYFADWRNIGYSFNGLTHARFGFAAAGPNAPATYRGPGAAAGGAATVFNSQNGCTGPDCEEHPSLACALPASCVATAAAFTICASTREDTGGGGTDASVAQLSEGKLWSYTVNAAACP